MPKLDYIARLDERNRAYRVTAPTTDLTRQTRWWTGGVVLDQGEEGTCVGHGVVGDYLASPVRGKLMPPRGFSAAEVGHLLAVQVFDRCAEIDEFEGVSRQNGTSVRAGMLVGRERGWWGAFRWAFNLTELRAALEDGPVVIGVDWREDMYDTRHNGDVVVSGPVVGGHCLLITGYSPNYAGRGPRFRWRNSWSPSYGLNGNGYITPANLDRILFRAGGEAAVPVGRTA